MSSDVIWWHRMTSDETSDERFHFSRTSDETSDGHLMNIRWNNIKLWTRLLLSSDVSSDVHLMFIWCSSDETSDVLEKIVVIWWHLMFIRCFITFSSSSNETSDVDLMRNTIFHPIFLRMKVQMSHQMYIWSTSDPHLMSLRMFQRQKLPKIHPMCIRWTSDEKSSISLDVSFELWSGLASNVTSDDFSDNLFDESPDCGSDGHLIGIWWLLRKSFRCVYRCWIWWTSDVHLMKHLRFIQMTIHELLEHPVRSRFAKILLLLGTRPISLLLAFPDFRTLPLTRRYELQTGQTRLQSNAQVEICLNHWSKVLIFTCMTFYSIDQIGIVSAKYCRVSILKMRSSYNGHGKCVFWTQLTDNVRLVHSLVSLQLVTTS